MKQLYLFFLLLFFAIGILDGSAEYHGNRRYWTAECDDKTYIVLNAMDKTEPKLFFPRNMTFNDIIADIKVSSKGTCKDAKSVLNFTLVINAENHIRGVIKFKNDGFFGNVKMNLYEKCGRTEVADHFKFGSIYKPKNLLSNNRECNPSNDLFLIYDGKKIMELQVSGTFECQVFMILPKYMEVEDMKLMNAGRLDLNATFAGHDEEFWWKKENDSMLPDGISFDSNGNIHIDILKSSKSIPNYFRIGFSQPIPSLKFSFGEKCNGAQLELYLNLRGNPDCRIGIHLIKNGFQIVTKSGEWYDIKNSSWSPTLVFGGNQVYVKIESPLSIHKFEVCELSNAPDVPADQFVLQIEKLGSVGKCEFAHLFIPRSDVAKEIEVLIDRSKISQLSSNDTAAAAPRAIRSKFFKSKF